MGKPVHKLDVTGVEKKKTALADLKKTAPAPKTVAQVVARLAKIEKYLGIK